MIVLVSATAHNWKLRIRDIRASGGKRAVRNSAIWQQNEDNQQPRRDCRGEARSYKVKGQIIEVTLRVWEFCCAGAVNVSGTWSVRALDSFRDRETNCREQSRADGKQMRQGA